MGVVTHERIDESLFERVRGRSRPQTASTAARLPDLPSSVRSARAPPPPAARVAASATADGADVPTASGADPASGAQVSKGAGKKKGGGAAKGSASIGADDDADADGGGGRGKKGDRVRAARAISARPRGPASHPRRHPWLS